MKKYTFPLAAFSTLFALLVRGALSFAADPIVVPGLNCNAMANTNNSCVQCRCGFTYESNKAPVAGGKAPLLTTKNCTFPDGLTFPDGSKSPMNKNPDPTKRASVNKTPRFPVSRGPGGQHAFGGPPLNRAGTEYANASISCEWCPVPAASIAKVDNAARGLVKGQMIIPIVEPGFIATENGTRCAGPGGWLERCTTDCVAWANTFKAPSKGADVDSLQVYVGADVWVNPRATCNQTTNPNLPLW